MAREQRKDVDWFPHVCNKPKELHILESRYGNDGYVAYYKLKEELGRAKNHYINIDDELDWMYLVSAFKVDEDLAQDILTHMAKLKIIDRELFEIHKVIWSEEFSSDLIELYKKRVNKLYFKVDVLAQITGQSAAETTQSAADSVEKRQKSTQSAESIPREEKSRGKKRTVEESREEDQSKNQRFSPPSQSDVEEYFSSKINETFWSDAECKKEAKKFVDFYTSKNWYVGKNKMKIWKSAASGWINRKEEFNTQKNGNKNNGRDNNSNQNGDKDFGEL
ncbi:DUF4373 domain-containing protein [Pedobacter agri]|uniref:DUF4373 domain-containing protein n=1 Tax=Pedobacter agri TaxID=454586 RepID=A0A9X3I9Q6_9SPHI|nr:DUF4373 domain-containing protein [Pedobacter agri]MCX3264793.1 DUF4373 domain-containing protein [Pedobacter agri]